MVLSNVIVDVTIPRRSFVFGQSRFCRFHQCKKPGSRSTIRTIKLNLLLKWLLGSNLSQFYKCFCSLIILYRKFKGLNIYYWVVDVLGELLRIWRIRYCMLLATLLTGIPSILWFHIRGKKKSVLLINTINYVIQLTLTLKRLSHRLSKCQSPSTTLPFRTTLVGTLKFNILTTTPLYRLTCRTLRLLSHTNNNL